MWNEHIKGYGTEDDLLTFVLYMKFGNPFLMNDIRVYHIWHEISDNNYVQLENNTKAYKKLLLMLQLKMKNVISNTILILQKKKISYIFTRFGKTKKH